MTYGRATFTDRVLAELAPHTPPLRCCRTALVEGMLWALGPASAAEDPDPPASAQPPPLLSTTRSAAARAALAALHANGVAARVERRRAARRVRYDLLAASDALRVSLSTERPCCRRAAVRGAVMAAGSFARAGGPPHLEVVVGDAAAGASLLSALDQLGIPAAVARRRGRSVVTVRTSEGVAAALTSIGAQDGRLRFEEGRVVRDVRGGVNRRINTETANLRRTVDAGLRQVRAAEALQRDEDRWRRLPPAVRQAALVRQRHPRDSLARLSARTGTTRAAMAGRLRRLLELADRPGG